MSVRDKVTSIQALIGSLAGKRGVQVSANVQHRAARINAEARKKKKRQQNQEKRSTKKGVRLKRGRGEIRS